jgi:hypothetical protein
MADDAKPVKLTVTNLDQGPRYVHQLGTMRVIGRSSAITALFTPAEADDIREQQCSDSEAPRFDVESAGASADEGSTEGKPLDKRPVAELRKMAEAEGVLLTDRKTEGGEPLPDLKTAGEIAAAIEAKRAAG